MATSHHNSHEYVELVNLSTGESVITGELDNWHFDQGFRFLRYVPNSEVDFPEVYAQQEDLALLRLRDGSIPRELAIAEGTHPYRDIEDDYHDSESYFIQPMEIY
jgi:hypothetical protein